MNQVIAERLECMQAGIQRLAERVPGLPGHDVALIRLVMLGGRGIGDELEAWLRPHRLGESEFRTLLLLFSSPDGSAFPGELCRYAAEKPTNMTRITHELVKRGLVMRKPYEADRRRVLLCITSRGRDLSGRLLPMLFEPVRTALAGFSPREKSELTRMLWKLMINLGQLSDTHEGSS